MLAGASRSCGTRRAAASTTSQTPTARSSPSAASSTTPTSTPTSSRAASRRCSTGTSPTPHTGARGSCAASTPSDTQSSGFLSPLRHSSHDVTAAAAVHLAGHRRRAAPHRAAAPLLRDATPPCRTSLRAVRAV
eukprot:1163336-Pleurochrysis_carterae.AAC.1